MPKIKTKTITLEVIERLFNVSNQKAADNLGIHERTLGLLCNKYGIRVWPYRQMKRIDKQVHRFSQSSSFDDRSLALVEDFKQRLPFSIQVVDQDDQDECPSVDIEFFVPVQTHVKKLKDAGIHKVADLTKYTNEVEISLKKYR